LLFVVCNVTNAIFFWAFLPETKGRPLEEMNRLFSETSWFVPGSKFRATEPETALTEKAVIQKQASIHEEEVN
jgi:hypothetical protein